MVSFVNYFLNSFQIGLNEKFITCRLMKSDFSFWLFSENFESFVSGLKGDRQDSLRELQLN